MLGLETTLHPPQTTQTSLQNPENQLEKHHQMMTFTHQHHDQQTQLSMRQPNYPYNSCNQYAPERIKTQMTLGNTDDDEPRSANDDNTLDGKRKSMSPWHRMKWTNNMARLLIVAVCYMGDEAGSELGSDKKKTGASSSSGLMQKKGKWKSVSKAMMEKGFFVSPQQCEDKFNDLNKRYKRVTDILGKGTACKVVENQSLLETMEISHKLKEEVRKLLNSKHVFFREMCAYHNSCGHGAVGPTTEAATTASVDATHHSQQQQARPQLQQEHQQLCLHSSTSTQMPPPSMVPSSSNLDNHDNEVDCDDDDDDEEEDDDEDEYDDEDEEQEEGGERKRARTTGGILSNSSSARQKLNGAITVVLQDVSKNPKEKKQWVISQLVQLEEKGVKFQYEGLELEKQRIKWIKFSSRKEREMEKMKIDNERNRLENERMVLLLRQKEIELLFLEQHPNSNPS